MGYDHCSLCFNELEYVDHLLLNCHFAWNVCGRNRRICAWCGWIGDRGFSIRDWLDKLNSINGTEKDKGTTSSIIMVTVWFVWPARNNLIFSSKHLSVDRMVEKIMVNVFLWLKYLSNSVGVM